MDINIDADPRIVQCHPHEFLAVGIYLFILRRGRMAHHPGRVRPITVDTHYLARCLFISEEQARNGLTALLRNELVTLWRNGDPLRVTESVTDPVMLVTEADTVQVVGWEREANQFGMTNAQRQAAWRDRQRELRRGSFSDIPPGPRINDTEKRPLVTANSNLREEESIRSEGDQISFVPDESGTSEDPPPRKKGRGSKTKSLADKIPERCFRGADRLRTMVLARNSEANIGHVAWDGLKRTGDVYKNPPPDGLQRKGHRLRWANTLRLMVEQDGKTYEQIFEVIQWLQFKQPRELGAGFIVESAEALRAKWGSIHAVMIGRSKGPKSIHDNASVDDAVAMLEKAMPSAAPPDTDSNTGNGVAT